MKFYIHSDKDLNVKTYIEASEDFTVVEHGEGDLLIELPSPVPDDTWDTPKKLVLNGQDYWFEELFNTK